ncbi:MAG TPA: sigma-70 family RNA polymerase sigma factor [Solirubrobacteraceae bacterium]
MNAAQTHAMRWRRRNRDGPRPVLPPAEERALVAAAKERAPEAREQLIDAFVPLIGSVARIYRGSSCVDRGELMQDGVVGLLRALERYDPALGTPFWAYASWWVRQAMQQLVSELARPVVLSDRALRQLARVRDAQREFVQRHGREPTATELADQAGLRLEQVEHLMVAERRPRGLEEPVGGDDDVGSTFGELLADPVAEDAYDRVPRHLEVERVRRLMARLDERERTIVVGRYGLNGPQRTLRELSLVLGVSAERVRQVEQAALAKLREAAPGAEVVGPQGRPTSAREEASHRGNEKGRDFNDDAHRSGRAVAARSEPAFHQRGSRRRLHSAG